MEVEIGCYVSVLCSKSKNTSNELRHSSVARTYGTFPSLIFPQSPLGSFVKLIRASPVISSGSSLTICLSGDSTARFLQPLHPQCFPHSLPLAKQEQ